jgi:hypothetical protein
MKESLHRRVGSSPQWQDASVHRSLARIMPNSIAAGPITLGVHSFRAHDGMGPAEVITHDRGREFNAPRGVGEPRVSRKSYRAQRTKRRGATDRDRQG